jgi:uncharacterized protein
MLNGSVVPPPAVAPGLATRREPPNRRNSWITFFSARSHLSRGALPMPHQKIKPQFTIWQLRVRRSPIQGWGVFAAEDIPKHRKVIEYTGERINRRETVRRFAQIWRSRKRIKRLCLFRLNQRWVLDGAVGGSGAELINHRCAPNLRSRRIRGHIFFFSRETIRKGEELTVDYGFPKTAVPVLCRCGSPACRGTINIR